MHENFTLCRVIMSFLFILELSRWDASTLNFLLGSALGRYPLASVESKELTKVKFPKRGRQDRGFKPRLQGTA